MVLVIHEGSHDRATGAVFRDVAAVTAFALRRLGCAVAVKHCVDLRLCRLSRRARLGRFFVVLGVHHLARYTVDTDGVPGGSGGGGGSSAVLQKGSAVLQAGFPNPATAALYNFEHASGQEDLAESPVLAAILRRWSDTAAAPRPLTTHTHSGGGGGVSVNASSFSLLWDYSEGNVQELARRGVAATHVPLAYAPLLETIPPVATTNYDDAEVVAGAVGNTEDEDEEGERPIDVLFYGMLNTYRRARLRELRAPPHNLRVLHANANGMAFGRRLHSLLTRSKIVLSLRFFDGEVREAID